MGRDLVYLVGGDLRVGQERPRSRDQSDPRARQRREPTDLAVEIGARRPVIGAHQPGQGRLDERRPHREVILGALHHVFGQPPREQPVTERDGEHQDQQRRAEQPQARTSGHGGASAKRYPTPRTVST